VERDPDVMRKAAEIAIFKPEKDWQISDVTP
jgi:hypothetical protein